MYYLLRSIVRFESGKNRYVTLDGNTFLIYQVSENSFSLSFFPIDQRTSNRRCVGAWLPLSERRFVCVEPASNPSLDGSAANVAVPTAGTNWAGAGSGGSELLSSCKRRRSSTSNCTFSTKLFTRTLSALSLISMDSIPQTPGADPTGSMTLISYTVHAVGSPTKKVVRKLLW